MVYETQLAHIHDRWFDSVASAAASHIRGVLGTRPAARVVDLGCGSGTLLEGLLGWATELVGIDISEAMISIARQKLPTARLHVDHVLTAKIPPTDVITLVGEVLSYAASSPFHPSDLVEFLTRARGALSEDGLLLFDVLGGHHDFTGTFFRDDTDCSVVSETHQVGDLVERRIVSFLKDGEHHRKSVEIHRLRAFSTRAIEEALLDAGFAWTRLDAYAHVPLMAGRLAYECRCAQAFTAWGSP